MFIRNMFYSSLYEANTCLYFIEYTYVEKDGGEPKVV